MGATRNNPTGGDPGNTESTADLVKRAAEQISTLVRDELKLAQAEITEKGKSAGFGLGLFGAAGVVALYGVLGLLTALTLALGLVMPYWLAALLVGVVLLGVAGILAVSGRTKVKQAAPPVPSETVASVKADIDTVTGAVRNGGHK
jgi:uncharacterized membrane protein YqjE